MGLEREQLKNRIPVKANASTLKNANETKSLLEEIENYDKLKFKLVDVIAKIYRVLDEDNIVPQMLQVLAKKTTEQQVLKDNLPKYETLIKEVDIIQSEINITKNNILSKNEVFLKLRASVLSPNSLNEKVQR